MEQILNLATAVVNLAAAIILLKAAKPRKRR